MKNRLRNLLLFGVMGWMLGYASAGFAQYRVTAATNISLLNPGNEYHVIPLENQGVVCAFEEDRARTSVLSVLLFDHALRRVWTYRSTEKQQGKLVDVGVGEQTVFLLRQHDGGAFEMEQVDLLTGEGTVKNFYPYLGFVAERMVVAGSTCFIAGKIDDHASAFRLGLEDEKPHILFHHLRNTTSLQSLEVNQEHRTVSFLAFVERPMGTDRMLINHYDFEGKPRGNFTISLNPAITLSQIQMTHVEKEELLLTGVYQKGSWKGYSGLFTAKINQRTVDAFRLYDYGQLKHFFKFLPPKEEERLGRRAARKHKNNSQLSLPYVVETLPLRYSQGEWLLSGNLFEAVWKPKQNPRYQFRGIVALGIDSDGRLRWDNLLPHIGATVELAHPEPLGAVRSEIGKLGFVYSLKDVLRDKYSSKRDFQHDVHASYLHGQSASGKEEYMYDSKFVAMSQQGFLHFGLKEIVDKKELEIQNMLLFLKKLELSPAIFAETDKGD